LERLLILGIGGYSSEIVSQVSALKEQYRGIHIVILGEAFRIEELLMSMECGADGYLVQTELTTDIIQEALDLALLGKTILPREFGQHIRKWAQGRTDRD